MRGTAVTETLGRLAEQAAQLRTAFDRAFAAPAHTDATVTVDFLAIRFGGDPYAIRLAEVSGLFINRRITQIPGNDASLLGIAGFRGSVLPVYGLAALFGQSQTPAPRWLVIAATAPIALAFDQFDGHLRAAADTILPQQPHAQSRGYAPDFLRSGEIVRPVLHVTSVINALGAASAAPPARSEQK
jgi:purine-binding chemotaxis protein CheW